MAGKNYDILVKHILENQGKFYKIAYCYTGSRDSALDVVQNAICKALENYMSMRNPQAVKTWFYRILLNEAFGFQRKSAREIAYDPADLREEIYTEPAFEAGLELFNEVCCLPEEMKSVVILHYYEQLTFKEISQVTGVNISTVKSRLYSALEKLKKIIGEAVE